MGINSPPNEVRKSFCELQLVLYFEDTAVKQLIYFCSKCDFKMKGNLFQKQLQEGFVTLCFVWFFS